MNPEMTMAMKRHEEREALRSVIQQWNANRLDLFELSEPNEVNYTENLILRSCTFFVFVIIGAYFYLCTINIKTSVRLPTLRVI